MPRLNFEVDEAVKEKLEALRVQRGTSTQKQVFEEALELLARRELLVRQQGRSLIAVRPEAVDRIAKTVGDVILVDVPSRASVWLVIREGWRRTPWLVGTRLHISDVMPLLDEPLSDEEAALELELPLQAIAACRGYIAENRDLIEAEEREAARRSRLTRKYATPPR
jgi:uncharacterized protein (DUF433 family)